MEGVRREGGKEWRKGGKKEGGTRRNDIKKGKEPKKKKLANLFVAKYEPINHTEVFMRFADCDVVLTHQKTMFLEKKTRAQVGRQSSSKQHGTVTIGSH